MNKLSAEEIALVYETAKKLRTVSPSVIEKDIFITRAIHAIADLALPQFNLIFCGGTCLAKAHKIVGRMSEDVDFKISPIIPFSSLSEQRRKLRELREQITRLLISAGFEANTNIRSRDNNSYTVYHLDFPSYFEQHQHLKPHIQLEFTLASHRLPTEVKSISSLVDVAFPDPKNISKNIHCISIIETAAEKWVALTRRIAAISRGHDSMDETLVRHLYDLQSITSQTDMAEDFFTLAIETINRDRLKFKRHHEYRNNPLDEIHHSINVISNDPVWLEHYNNFLESMVFDRENATFEKCLEQLQKFTKQIALHPKFEQLLQLNIVADDEAFKSPSSLLTKQALNQLKLYVEMQVKLTNIVEEKQKLAPDDKQSHQLLERAKQLNGRIIKLAKEIIAIPEVVKLLSEAQDNQLPEKNCKKAKEIRQRLKNNEISIDDIKLILRHVKRAAIKLSKNIDDQLAISFK
ncbi:MAG: nucleotidyl transferase AbiEii/AbiGii toxin family protein [Legionellales bacterium]|nr:nucleotidyl transferase AbiEii/AbiGii toxin family protein [Legionellales bacterium]